MKHGKQPHCYVVAGPNGAGKTTFALKYLPQIASCHDFINADEIAKGLSPLDCEAGLLRASKIFLETLKRKIVEQIDFALRPLFPGAPICPVSSNGANPAGLSPCSTSTFPMPSFPHKECIIGCWKADTTYRRQRSSDGIREAYGICLTMLKSVTNTICLDNTGNRIVSIFEKRLGHPIEIQGKERFAKIQGDLNHE